MAIKHAAWTHGVGVVLESPSWTAFRQGFFATVRPSTESNTGWVHFVIPTPVIVDGARLKAGSALLRYTTGSGARITIFRVYDGEKELVDYSGLNLQGNLQLERRNVTGSPEVLFGTVITLLVQFSGNGPNDYIQFISAGIDFFN